MKIRNVKKKKKKQPKTRSHPIPSRNGARGGGLFPSFDPPKICQNPAPNPPRPQWSSKWGQKKYDKSNQPRIGPDHQENGAGGEGPLPPSDPRRLYP